MTQQRGLSRFCRQLVVSEVRVIDRLTDARNHCHPVSKPEAYLFLGNFGVNPLLYCEEIGPNTYKYGQRRQE